MVSPASDALSFVRVTAAVVGLLSTIGAVPGTCATQSANPPPAPAGVIVLSDALSAVLVGNPELSAFAFETRAREAEALQAAARPNPELRADVENIGGSNGYGGFERAETTLLLSQLLELGGKRGERRRAAALRGELAQWDYEAKRLSLLSEATKAFVATLAAQERLRLSEEFERLARESASASERSVRAGASPPVEATRARVVLGRARLDHRQAANALEAARHALAAMWGNGHATFERASGTLEEMRGMPRGDVLRAALDQNPDVARWTTERESRAADLALERARRLPDLTVGAGPRYFSDTDDAALVLQFALPLPLLDRNAGAIRAAEQRLEKADAERRGAERSARSALLTTTAALTAAYEQVIVLREHVLPAAETSCREALHAFRGGLYRSLDVLDARRTLFDLRVEYIRALEAFHLAAADIERLTGQPLHTIGDGGGE